MELEEKNTLSYLIIVSSFEHQAQLLDIFSQNYVAISFFMVLNQRIGFLTEFIVNWYIFGGDSLLTT